jgi:hypothetical protein
LATVNNNFRIKNGLVVEGTTATVNGLNILTTSTFGTLNTFTTTQTITPATSVTGLIINSAASSKGLILKNNATTPGNPFEIQNSGGSPIFTINSSGVINLGGTTTIGNILNFSDPGIAVETRFNFLRATDSAWLAVNEYSNDATYYEFGMSDNPGGGDYYQWRFDDWTAPGHGWMPLQIGAYTTRFIAPSITQYGNIALNPYNTAFATVNNVVTSASNYTVNRYTPTNSTVYQLKKDVGTGIGTVTLNTQTYTGSNIRNYWIEIETGGTTFKWGIDSAAFGGTLATGVSITGAAQTLDNGLQVTLSLAGHIVGDRWSWQSSPRRTIAIGGSPITGAMEIIYPSAGLVGTVIRGASGQSVNLQEWQNSNPSTVASVSNSGNITAAQFIRTGGTASQYLMADGSVTSTINLPEIIPLDDIRGEFNGINSIFVPKYQGIKQSITNPLRLQLTINGIIQYVDFPDYVWQSPLPREGFQINNDGNIAFSEVVPAGSSFDARIMPGPDVVTKIRQYPFKAVDILLGG